MGEHEFKRTVIEQFGRVTVSLVDNAPTAIMVSTGTAGLGRSGTTHVNRDRNRLWIEYPFVHEWFPGVATAVIFLGVLACYGFVIGEMIDWHKVDLFLLGGTVSAVMIVLGLIWITAGRTERIDIDSKMITVSRGQATQFEWLRRDVEDVWVSPRETQPRWTRRLVQPLRVGWGRPVPAGAPALGLTAAGLTDVEAEHLVEIMKVYMGEVSADMEFELVDPFFGPSKRKKSRKEWE